MAEPRLNQASGASFGSSWTRFCSQLPEKLSAVLPRLLPAVPELTAILDAVRNRAPAGACSSIALDGLAESLGGRSHGLDEQLRRIAIHEHRRHQQSRCQDSHRVLHT